jgi:hypothetical protein
MRRASATVVASLAVLCLAQPSRAVFHVAVIDEVLTSYGGDAHVQFIEIRMLASLQNFVQHSVFAAFDANGTYIADILETPGNVTNSGNDVRWLLGTSAFQTASGLTPDFVIPAGILPTGGGMVCYGGGKNAIAPQNPPTWDRTDFDNYVDCLAYGSYAGPSNAKIGTPTSLNADGHSLQRTMTGHDNATDFACADPAVPENNASQTKSMPATSPCAAGATATPTSTPTATAVPTGTTAACVGDCNGDGMVEINELILGVNIDLGSQPLSACPSFACHGGSSVTIDCLVRAVHNALEGCPATPTPTATTTTAGAQTPLPGGALGVRRFSLNPDTSQFIAVLGPGLAFPTSGFEGFLELTAEAPDPATGLAFIDVTDASDYLSIDVPTGSTAICLKVLRDQLPVQHAGLVACKGGLPLGIQVTQDHHMGQVGTCSGPTSEGQACSNNGDCADGVCFTAAMCTVAGGTVEGPARPHPGVCNGPLAGKQGTDVSPAGTVVIASNPPIINGLPVELSQEQSTPCGDEGVTGMRVAIGFTTGRSTSEILHFNNGAASDTLSGEVTGVPFSCAAWTEENGPGTLVLSATNLDTQVVGSVSDIVAQFVLAD